MLRPSSDSDSPAGRRMVIRGTVQGVGFRPCVVRLARELGVGGRVRNDPRGVIIEAFASAGALDRFLARLKAEAPAAARIRDLTCESIPPEPVGDLVIVESGSSGERALSIPPDIATCPDCERELFDAGDRRFRYPFTNCTACGPRFTIATDIPYDRGATTMAPFEMCPACRREYEDLSDRRFHAQPNACSLCGPALLLLDSFGVSVPGDPIEAAARLLLDGSILAVKGLGGYHLACDATREDVVATLRTRKHRDAKPFAVMVTDLAAARRHSQLGPEDERLLASAERPITLVTRRERSGIVSAVAPDTSLIGLFLPYTPLHHLLLRAFGGPLVMTSGNQADEPICQRDDEAGDRLGGIADAFLLHDRAVATRCDDSVVRVVAGKATVMRRSRGYVPRALGLRSTLRRPVLACGAHLKNTFCLAVGDTAYLGPHIGDLESLEAVRFYSQAVARLERILSIAPEIIAHDLHPDYESTRYALERPEPVKVGVQHHHAHVVSAMAEHGLDGPVLGVAYDGTGWGPDGTAWGGEVLLATAVDYERVATFRPMRLPGGARAISEPWRVALSLLMDAYAGDPPLSALRLFDGIDPGRVRVVRQLLERDLQSPRARGVGRLFDAFGALGLSRPVARYEGQVAMAWNLSADPSERRSYPLGIEEVGGLQTVDPRPMVLAAVADLVEGRDPGVVSARFHNAIVSVTGQLVRSGLSRLGRMPVMLTGGCFQNPRLVEGITADLGPGVDLRTHGQVPPNDGGVALGQALVAAARAGAYMTDAGGV